MKIAIITSICGNKEPLCNPNTIHENADYYAFVDNIVPNLIWDQTTPLHFSNDNIYSMRRDAKIYKILPELFIPNYDYYIWVDASHDVIMDPEKICSTLIKDSDYGVFKHRERSCIYKESDELIKLNYDHINLIKDEMQYFRNIGFPENSGLFELPSFVKRRSEKSMLLSLKWWEYICKWSSRDQLSFPVCVWESGANITILDGFINGDNKNGILEQTRRHVESGGST